MSLQLAAQHLAAQGRGPDTQLVHMSLGEVKSLQELAKAHGGSLSINPDTGLPEAGFLSKLLPVIAGFGLTALSGGALSPLMASMITGGVTGVATGSLKQGLMAGLGAYGGAGLGAGLAATGGQQIAGQAIAREAALEGLTLPAGYAQSAAATATPAQIAAAQSATPALDVLGAGTDAIKQNGFGAFKSGMQAAEAAGGPSLLRSGLAVATPLLSGMGDDYTPPGTKPTTPTTPLQYSANPVSPTPQADVPLYGGLGQDFGRQQRYFSHQFSPVNPPAPAPVVAMAPVTNMPGDFNYGGGMAAGGPVEAMSAANVYDMQNARGGVSDMGVDMSTGMQKMARGGISDLGDYSDGGRLLRGPGDGVSDSIPAVIGRKRPARLADGEFVVPARIVSELGNGSTEAGARKLYAMMNRVQAARGKTTGKGRVAKNTRAEKYLPA